MTAPQGSDQGEGSGFLQIRSGVFPSLTAEFTAMGAQAGATDSSPFDEIAALLAREIEHNQQPAARSDLAIRLGLLCWDVFDDPEAAGRYLSLKGVEHPAAPNLRFLLAITLRDTAALIRLQDERAKLSSDQRAEWYPNLFDFAEAWLYRFQDVQKAIRATQIGVMEKGHAIPEQGQAELLWVLFRLSKEWRALSRLLSSRPLSKITPGRLELSHILADRLQDWDGAFRALVSNQSPSKTGLVEMDPYALERMIE